jgi:hypothetical protein
MVALSWSGHWTQLRTGHRVGISLATMTSSALLVTVLLVVDCGQYFMNPSTGELLVLNGGNSNPEPIYGSSDLGQHWTSFSMPRNYTAVTQLVSFSVGNPSWHLCGEPTSTSTEETYMCTMDGGRTWTPRPMLGAVTLP